MTTDMSTVMTRREVLKRAALMLGAALSPRIFSYSLEAAAQVSPNQAKARFLPAELHKIAGAFSERILPRTSTPGATDAGVGDFIDIMYGKYLSVEERKLLDDGLSELDAASRNLHRAGFASLPGVDQDAMIMRLATESKDREKSFLAQIRELVIVGYFTSEIVGKTVLGYDPVPGRFDPCIPLSETGNVLWNR